MLKQTHPFLTFQCSNHQYLSKTFNTKFNLRCVLLKHSDKKSLAEPWPENINSIEPYSSKYTPSSLFNVVITNTYQRVSIHMTHISLHFTITIQWNDLWNPLQILSQLAMKTADNPQTAGYQCSWSKCSWEMLAKIDGFRNLSCSRVILDFRSNLFMDSMKLVIHWLHPIHWVKPLVLLLFFEPPLFSALVDKTYTAGSLGWEDLTHQNFLTLTLNSRSQSHFKVKNFHFYFLYF